MWNRVKYLITDCSTSCMSVLLSAISLWHYSFRSYKMCYSTLSHIWTFDTPWPPWRRRSPWKSPLDCATDLLSKIWQHITTVSFVSVFIVVCSRKPKNASGRVWMGPKQKLVHFKSLFGCLPINSWSSSPHLYAGKLDGVGPVDNRPSTNKLHHFVQKKNYMWHVTRDMWHMTRDTWHMTRDTFGGLNILSKFQLPSSYRLWYMILSRSGGKGWVT